jgi:hypothetical protein
MQSPKVSASARESMLKAVVTSVFPDHVEILGPLFDELVATEISAHKTPFTQPSTGEHFDLAPIIEMIKNTLELTNAAIALYIFLNSVPNSKTGAGSVNATPPESPKAKVEEIVTTALNAVTNTKSE